jgi:AraC family transcriptional regulator
LVFAVKKMDVKIVKLEPMKVASFHALGESPEQAAWDKLIAWARPLGILHNPENRLFGFNNPNPSPGKKEYGYEAWIRVADDFEDENVTIKDFPGGDYAVARVEVPKGKFEVITERWMELVRWQKKSGCSCADNICLEESIRTDRKDLEFILDLYHPIKV